MRPSDCSRSIPLEHASKRSEQKTSHLACWAHVHYNLIEGILALPFSCQTNLKWATDVALMTQNFLLFLFLALTWQPWPSYMSDEHLAFFRGRWSSLLFVRQCTLSTYEKHLTANFLKSDTEEPVVGNGFFFSLRFIRLRLTAHLMRKSISFISLESNVWRERTFRA